ncbi:hypothetical protein ES708_31733 [subsurface metagenome]
MMPERLNFLGKFDNFYQVMVNSVKENKISERAFYSIIRARCKSMDQERRKDDSSPIDDTDNPMIQESIETFD